MDLLELKFLLKLLGFPDYRAPIAKVKPNPETKAAERDSICRTLSDRELVAYNIEVTQLAIAPPGKSLLGLDTARLPITDEELKVLQACAAASISPEQTGIPIASRQAIVQGLASRGLLKAEKTQIKEVWLTERGQEYLLRDCTPTGSAPAITLDMLTHYLRFMRKSLKHPIAENSDKDGRSHQEIPANPPEESQAKPALVSASKGSAKGASKGVTAPLVKEEPAVALELRNLSDADILQAIRDLDRELGTDNYLPIYYLRQKLQPPLTRDELDRALYRLQRNDQLELSSLQEAIAYTPEQIEAGISQDVGGPLFFLIVT